ncbi:MAG: PhzF family phenazine biosynthesis protein, partial [Frankia sp.]|nr:PhzF family phenazine biosynthesis protein [Frankia sp.]
MISIPKEDTLRFVQVDVFAQRPYAGNPLAVFPDAGALDARQMQAIAAEMNLSETTFVTAIRNARYDVRIFTPGTELPFAGHPTLGTAWVLRHLGLVTDDHVVQVSAAGETPVVVEGEVVWFTRSGSAGADVPDAARASIAAALGVAVTDLGVAAPGMGRGGMLAPAVADAGLAHLCVPVAGLDVLGRLSLDRPLTELNAQGMYAFTVTDRGLQARGLFPGAGIAEDPATGSAAAALGCYLAARLG